MADAYKNLAAKRDALKDATANTDVGVRAKAKKPDTFEKKAMKDTGPTMEKGEKVSDYMARVKAWAAASK
jgi:hypothetical protein